MKPALFPLTVVDAPVVRLSGGGPVSATTDGWSDWLKFSDLGLYAFGAVFVAGFALILLSMLARWWYGLSPTQRAAWWLSRRARLSRAERRLLKGLAAHRPGVDVVALLLSARAFARCAAPERHSPAEAAATERLRVRLHGR